MKYKISIICLCFSLVSMAQVPGYMGKRFMIGYSNYFSPAFINPGINSSTDGSLGLNTVHCANIEYVTKKRTSLCLSVQFGKMGMIRAEGYRYAHYDPIYDYTEYYTAYYQPTNKLPMQVISRNVSLGFKFFRQGMLAPVGKYTKLELLVSSNTIEYDPNSFYDRSFGDDPIAALGDGSSNFKSWAIALTLGKQRVFFNSIVVDRGFRFGIVPNTVGAYVFNDLFDDAYSAHFSQDLKQTMNNRLFSSQLVNFHIGIGFLAF